MNYSEYVTTGSAKRYWHQKHGCEVPTAEEVPCGSYMMHMLEAVMAAARHIPKPAVTCYLISRATWEDLVKRIPVREVGADERLPFSPWPGLATLQGIPIFVYQSDEERLTLRDQLMQAGHVVGEVQHGPVL